MQYHILSIYYRVLLNIKYYWIFVVVGWSLFSTDWTCLICVCWVVKYLSSVKVFSNKLWRGHKPFFHENAHISLKACSTKGLFAVLLGEEWHAKTLITVKKRTPSKPDASECDAIKYKHNVTTVSSGVDTVLLDSLWLDVCWCLSVRCELAFRPALSEPRAVRHCVDSGAGKTSCLL